MKPSILIQELWNAFTEWQQEHKANTYVHCGCRHGVRGMYRNNTQGKNPNVCGSRQAQTRPYNKKCFNCSKTRHFLHDCQLPPTNETKKKHAKKTEKVKTVNNELSVNNIQVINSVESLNIEPSVFIKNISDNILMTD